jgi:hypothetical protein
MPISINGTGTITGISAGGLPDGCITNDDIASSTITSAKLASGATNPKLGQIQSTNVTAASFTTTSGTYVDVTGLSVSITPTSSSSKIFVIYSVFGSSTNHAAMRLVRDSTAINIGVAGGSKTVCSGVGFQSDGSATGYEGGVVSGNIVDSPNTTSAVTYKIQALTYGASTFYLNTTNLDADVSYTYRGASTITAIEVLV